MTKSELNLRLAKALYPLLEWVVEPEHEAFVHPVGCVKAVGESGGNVSYFKWFDYRVWNYLMPHVIEHEIDLYRTRKPELQPDHPRTWIAFHGDSKISRANRNSQRALAECLLKVLEKGNG